MGGESKVFMSFVIFKPFILIATPTVCIVVWLIWQVAHFGAGGL